MMEDGFADALAAQAGWTDGWIKFIADAICFAANTAQPEFPSGNYIETLQCFVTYVSKIDALFRVCLTLDKASRYRDWRMNWIE